MTRSEAALAIARGSDRWLKKYFVVVPAGVMSKKPVRFQVADAVLVDVLADEIQRAMVEAYRQGVLHGRDLSDEGGE